MASFNPIEVSVQVDLEGGSSVTSGSGRAIKGALEAVMKTISAKDFPISIKPVINAAAFKESIKNRLENMAVDIDVNAHVKSVEGELSPPRQPKGVSAGSPVKSNKASDVVKSADPEYEKAMEAELKKGRDDLAAAIKKSVKGIFTDAQKATNEFGKSSNVEAVRDMRRLRNLTAKAAGDIQKASLPSNSLDPNYNNAEFLTDRNKRMDTQGYISPAVSYINKFLDKTEALTKRKYLDNDISVDKDELTDDMEQFKSAFSDLIKDLNNQYKLNIKSTGFAPYENKATTDKSTSGKSAVDPTALADALSKIQVNPIDKTTANAIDSIKKNVEAIAKSIPSDKATSKAAKESTAKADKNSLSSADLKKTLSAAVSAGIKEGFSGINLGGGSDIANAISEAVQSISSLKIDNLNLESIIPADTQAAIKSISDSLSGKKQKSQKGKVSRNEQNRKESSPATSIAESQVTTSTLSPTFETDLTQAVSSAIAGAVQQFANNGSASTQPEQVSSTDYSDMLSQIIAGISNISGNTPPGGEQAVSIEALAKSISDSIALSMRDVLGDNAAFDSIIRSAVTDSLKTLPAVELNSNTINQIKDAISDIPTPYYSVVVPEPKDYSEVLGNIETNTREKETDTVKSKDIAKEISNGIVSALKKAGAVQPKEKKDKKAETEKEAARVAEAERKRLEEAAKAYDKLEAAINNLGKAYSDLYKAALNGDTDLSLDATARLNSANESMRSAREDIRQRGNPDSDRLTSLNALESKYEKENDTNQRDIRNRFSKLVEQQKAELRALYTTSANIDAEAIKNTQDRIAELDRQIQTIGKSVPSMFDPAQKELEDIRKSATQNLGAEYEKRLIADWRSVKSGGAGDAVLDSMKSRIQSDPVVGSKYDDTYFANIAKRVEQENETYSKLVESAQDYEKARKELDKVLVTNNYEQIAEAVKGLNQQYSEFVSNRNRVVSLPDYNENWKQYADKDISIKPKREDNTVKKMVNQRLKLQSQMNKAQLDRMKAPEDSERYSRDTATIERLGRDIHYLDSALDSLRGNYGEFMDGLDAQLDNMSNSFRQQESVISAQLSEYKSLREEVEKLAEAQKALDNATLHNDSAGISAAQQAFDEAQNAVNDRRAKIQQDNLSDDSLSRDVSDLENQKQFERLTEITRGYYDVKLRLLRLDSDEAAQQSDEYKELQRLSNAYGQLKEAVRATINDSEFESNSRFHNLKNEEDALKRRVTLETSRSKALQTINKWQTKNSRAAQEYADSLSGIVTGLKANDITEEGVTSLKMAYDQIVAEATARGITGRNETEAELRANTATAKSLMQRYQDLLSKADAKAFKQFGTEISATKSAIDDAMKFGTDDSLKNARRQLSELTTEFKTAGYAGGNLFTSLDKKIRGLGQLFISGGVVAQIRQQLTGARDSVVNLDSAFANIRMTMKMSNEDMQKLGSQSIILAKELGTSLESITQAATIYANQNITTEEIMNRAKPTALLATAAEMGSSSAADLIQGAMYQFEMEDTVDNLNRVVDVVEKISASTGVEFKRSIEQISEGIQTTGAMAHEAGYSIEQYSALIGGLVEKTRRNGSELANSVKMIFARLGQNKDGEATDEEISNAEKAYKSIGISLRDGSDSFRALPLVFKELNGKWKTMTDVQKAYIAEVSAGNRNRSVFMAMMNGYDTIAKLTEDANNSAGYAEEANEARMESYEAKLGQLKATAQGFWNNLTDAEPMKIAVDTATKLVDIVDTLVNKVPVLSGVVRGLLAALAVKSLPNFITELSQSDSTLGIFARTIKSIIPNIKEYNKALDNFAAVDKTNMNSVLQAFRGEGSMDEKKLLAKAIGLDDEQIQAAVEAVESGMEKFQTEAESAVENAVLDDSAIRDMIEQLSEQEIDLPDSVELPVHAVIDDSAENLGDVESVITSITDSLSPEPDDAQNWLNYSGAVNGATEAQALNTAATQAGNVAINAQTGAEIQRSAAGVAGTGADTAHAVAQASLGQRISITTKKILAQAAAWAATPIGMFTIIATSIGAIAGGMSLLQQKSEEAKEQLEETFNAATEAAQKYREETDKLQNSEKKVVELSGKFRRLSEGVSENGYRVSLTREEYEEYKSVVSEIANLAPSLVSGYNSENVALINLGKTVDETREKYKSLGKELARDFIKENEDTVLEANKGQFKAPYSFAVEYDPSVLPEFARDFKAVMDSLENPSSDWGSAYDKFLEKYDGLYGEQMTLYFDKMAEDMGYVSHTDLYNKIHEKQEIPFDKINDAIKEYDEVLSQTRENVNQLIKSEMQTKDEFYDLSNEQKEFIDSTLDSLTQNKEFYKSLAYGDTSTSGFAKFMLKIATGNTTSDLVESKKKLETQYKNGEIVLSQYKSKMQELKKLAEEAVKDSEFADLFSGRFSTAEAEETRDKLLWKFNNREILNLAKILNDEVYNEYKALPSLTIGTLDYNADDQVTPLIRKELDGILDKFSDEDIELITHLDINPEWNEEDLKDEIKREKLRAKKYVEDNFNYLDSGYKSDIETFTTAIGKLQTAMKSVESMPTDDLLDLMMAFNTFDWASFGVTGEQGVGDLKGAINALIDKSLVDLKKAFGNVSDDKIKVFADMADNARKAALKVDDLAEAMNNLKSSYDTLKEVQQEAAKYGRIGIDTVADLIDKYPDLSVAGAKYISGKISLSDFMAEFKKSYDEAYKESARYIFNKALEDDSVRKEYDKFVADKQSEIEIKKYAAIEEQRKRRVESLEKKSKDILSQFEEGISGNSKYFDKDKMELDTTAMARDKISQEAIDGALQNLDKTKTALSEVETAIKAVNAASSEFRTSKMVADFWEKMRDEYNLDLDNYASYNEAKERITQCLVEKAKEQAGEYAKYVDFSTFTVDTKAMADDGVSGTEISSYVQRVIGIRDQSLALSDVIRGYFENSAVISTEFVNKAAEIYDVDISNCRSYASAKRKIYLQMTKINNKYGKYLGDLIDEETGSFNFTKAKYYYKFGDDSLEAMKDIAEEYQKLIALEKDAEDIDYEFFNKNKINLAGTAEEAEELNNILSEMISLYDEVFNGIKAVADKRIETLEKEKKALEDKNDEEQKEIDLIKARQQLEDAKRNKNIRVYYENKGFVWEADKTAIKEAEENLKDKENDAKIDAIDKQIDALNDYSDSISKLTEDIDNEKSISAAMRHFGVDSADKLLELSADKLKTVQDNYRALSLANDKVENKDNSVLYTAMTDEQIRERFGSNFGMSVEALKDYWSGAYFIPDTIKEFAAAEKKVSQAIANNKTETVKSNNKNYYIENFNINYSGDSFEEILKEAERYSRTR